MDTVNELEAIAQEIENCATCKIGKQGVSVPGEGNPDASVVFIGEAPGKQEALLGRPFIGRSGKLLRSLIQGIGLDEKDVFITSPVKYLPNRGTPTSSDIAHGREHLMKQLHVINPRFVVLLGRVAAEGVLQKKVTIATEHGHIIAKNCGIAYFLTYHPSAALRFRKNLMPLTEDFRQLRTLLS